MYIYEEISCTVFIQDDGLMILCAVCHNWQHGVCFLIKNDDEAPEHHICNTCCKVGLYYSISYQMH